MRPTCVCNVNVTKAFESGLSDMKGFFMGDDYRHHFEAEAKRNLFESPKIRPSKVALHTFKYL